jgi:hypothetical protein
MKRPKTKMRFAIDAARRGLRVTLLKPNSAEPLLPNWRETATTDPDQIRECWKLCPDANIGISTDGLLVIHVDSEASIEAIAELGELFRRNPGTPKSVRTHRVIGEGVEAYFLFLLPRGASVEARAQLMGFPGISLLASSAQALVGPGSTIDDTECELSNQNSLAPAAAWLLDFCGVQLAEGEKTMNVVAMEKSTSPAAPTSAPVKTKLDWALEAAKYIPVHPIRRYVDPGPNASPDEREKAAKAAKAALRTDWPNRATQDPKQVRELWTQYPDANIGGATNDFIVVDIDNRNGGDETFAGLLAVEYDFPETATTRTQGGGRHLIYVAPDGPLKGGNHKLGNGIDVKAAGGYVLMPGSAIEGRQYAREDARPPVFAPPWLVAHLKAAKPKTAAAGKRIAPDDEHARTAAEYWMERKAPRAESGNRDNTAIKVALKLGDFGCGYDTMLDIMLGWNETHCEPPLDLEDLQRICGSAGHNRENAIGCLHRDASGFEAVEISERPAPPMARIPSAKMGDDQTWENEPNAIFVDHLKPADLPVGVLPDLVEQFARDRALRLGVDAGAPAAALVTTLGSLVPAGNRLQMRQLDTE